MQQDFSKRYKDLADELSLIEERLEEARRLRKTLPERPIDWGNRALELIRATYGQSSHYYNNFSTALHVFTRSRWGERLTMEWNNLRATFTAARKDYDANRPAALSEGLIGRKREVFLAYRFADKESVTGLKRYLSRRKFKWIEGKRSDIGSISEDILNKIRSAGFVLIVMTKEAKLKRGGWTTSSWLLEEKGASIAFGHRPLIMVEEGIERECVGYLQSDDQMVYFRKGTFFDRAIEAVEMIENTLRGNRLDPLRPCP